MSYDKDIMDAYLKDEDNSMMDAETFEMYKQELSKTYGYCLFEVNVRIRNAVNEILKPINLKLK